MNLFRYLLFYAALCPGAFIAVLGQEPAWIEHYANSGQNSGFRLCWDGQDRLFGIGSLQGNATLDGTNVTVLGTEDILIVRWDTTGSIIWARTAGGDCEPGDTDNGNDIHYDPESNQLITTGYFTCPQSQFGSHVLNGSGPLSGVTDAFLAAYDIYGDCSWVRQISGFSILGLGDVLTDADGSVFLPGYADISPIAFNGTPVVLVPAGGFIAKYTNNGSLQYAERVLTNGKLFGAAWASTDEWCVFGSAKPNSSLFSQNLTAIASAGDGFVARVDTSGTVQWVTMLPSSVSAVTLGSVVPDDGSCVIRGHFRGDLFLPSDTLIGSPSVTKSFVARLSSQGEILWAKRFSSIGPALIYDLDLDPNGDVLVYGRFEGGLQIGETSISSAGSKSGLLCRLGSDGTLKAAMTFARVPYGTGSVLATDHGVYLSSEFDSTMTLGSTVILGSQPSLGDDLFLARFDSLSGFTNVPTAMAPEGGALVIYANPNEGRATVELPKGLAPGSTVRLLVRDAQGQLVQEEAFAVSARGTVQLDISAQAKGVYHVELLDERRRYTGKVVFE